MPQPSDIPFLNENEKSSLSDVLARFRATPSSAAPPFEAERFTPERATSLANELLALAWRTPSPGLAAHLAAMLCAVPALEGGALAVVAQRHEALLAEAGRDKHVLHATQARLLVHAALALHDDAALRPWCDLGALAAEQARLSAVRDKELSDAEKDYLRFLNKIEHAGLLRRRCAVPDPASILALGERFPNFAEPIAFFAEQAALARLSGAASFQPAPILLDGPAGVGKTHFATALAELLGTRSETLNMASQSCAFTLSGLDRGWSSARPGLVFNALLHGASMAPVIVLDELDKASQDARSDPLGPLYALLEPRNAATFRDEYAGIPVDASQAIWLATSNERARIPTALLSRFRVFEIGMLRPHELEAIAEGVFASLAAGIPGAPPRLPASWQACLAGQSPRQVRIALQQGLGRAALRAVESGASAITLHTDDLPAAPTGRPTIGFC